MRLRRQPVRAVAGDPEAIEKRLFELSQLKRKLKMTLDEIVNLDSEIENNLNFLDACGLDHKRLAREEHRLVTALAETLETLSLSRRDAAERLSAALCGTLAGLGFSKDVQVLFDFSPVEIYTPASPELTPLTEDRARILWCPNPGQPPQPLDRIASGGELSRFLLALMPSPIKRNTYFGSRPVSAPAVGANSTRSRSAQARRWHRAAEKDENAAPRMRMSRSRMA